ncbi:MAG TPA: TonB-dependent receptor [Gemmatimonadales bacterium]|nr:TonB-dependent receptor [Gemmatimonadales bacterium]
MGSLQFGRALLVVALLGGGSGVAAPSLLAQAEGAITGRATVAGNQQPLPGVEILVDGRAGAVSDTGGAFRIRSVRAGWHQVSARLIGYRGVVLDSVQVPGGTSVAVTFALEAGTQELEPVVVSAPYDAVLDPLATSTEQKFTGVELRQLPVSSVGEAIALSAGAVGTSYRGGRLGEESFILDGLGVKNQLDASSGGLGLQVPPDLLSETSLITNGFSARYGQALSGLVNVVTLDPGDRWEGRAAYESDRPFGGDLDRGLDRFIVRAGGPVVGKVGVIGALDVNGRMDFDAVNAPSPEDPADPRNATPYPLPHNSAEQWTGVGKIMVPVGQRVTVRALGLHSEDQRLLYDPVYKYDPDFAPGQRLQGSLLTGHVQWTSGPRARHPLSVDVRGSRFVREFFRGELVEQPDYALGALTGSRFHFVGEDRAKALDPSTAPIAGMLRPSESIRSPWGVPAFFFSGGSKGDLAYNRFGETRLQVDALYGLRRVDIYVGAQHVAQQVRSYQRVLGYLPAGDTIPLPARSAFSPAATSAYAEGQIRIEDIAVSAGLRYDQFAPGSDLPGESRGARSELSPRFAVSTVLRGATVVASFGRFNQAPDYQFLVDAAFDDTTRTGRFRQGNPDLGFEEATQYELSVRIRPRPGIAVRVGAYHKRLDGLVASVPIGVDPDSTVFGNADAGTVQGAEVLVEREMTDGIGVRVAYTLQSAEATATDPFLISRFITVDPSTGDTIVPARAEFPLDFDQRHTVTAILRGRVNDGAGPSVGRVRPLAGLEGAVIFRLASGLPYSRTDSTGVVLVGTPNGARLPSTRTLDLLIRRPIRLGSTQGGIYLDVRNLLNRQNIVAVRRDVGQPAPDSATVQRSAEQAYQAHPEAIPYESARYRDSADLDGNGFIEGRGELFPMYLAAARDFLQPVFAYGPPRLARLGFEFVF